MANDTLASKAQYREFQSASGAFTVRAKFTTMNAEDKVFLKREDNGKVITVPLAELSDDDQEWIVEKLKTAGK